jgi:peptide deformylase
MAFLKILQYPDERLHTVARRVPTVTDEIRTLVDDMAETTQVDVHQRVIVIDISDTRNQLHVLINPEIIARNGESDNEEGCLSVPGVFGKVQRAGKVTVEATDRDGKPFVFDADGLLAVCIQHEMDHLVGKVFVEYWSQMKQSRLQARLKKLRRKVL